MEKLPEVANFHAHSIARWRDGVRENFLPLEFSNAHKRDFAATLTGRQLGGAHLAHVTTDAHRVVRTHALAERSEQRYFKLFWQIAGASRVAQTGRTGELKPGYWTFYDTSRPYDIEIGEGSRFVVMLLPGELCQGWQTPAAAHTAQAIRSSGASRVALASAMTALHDPEACDALQADTVVASISGLMLTALKTGAEPGLQHTAHARLTQAQQLISRHIDNPDLTPEDVAKELQVSRRTLYSWFAQTGQSPFAFIQRTRLERCRLALIDPTTRDKSITCLAFDHGFSDMAHFSRLFKATYGASPRDYRKRFHT